MRVVLKSGETIDCDSYNIGEHGVKIHDKSDGVENIGFIPHDLLHGIVPDDFEFNSEDGSSGESGVYTV